MRPLPSALVLSGTEYGAPSLCNQVAQRRPTESKSARCCGTKGSRPYKKEGQGSFSAWSLELVKGAMDFSKMLAKCALNIFEGGGWM
jgi:hypothetical protein